MGKISSNSDTPTPVITVDDGCCSEENCKCDEVIDVIDDDEDILVVSGPSESTEKHKNDSSSEVFECIKGEKPEDTTSSNIRLTSTKDLHSSILNIGNDRSKRKMNSSFYVETSDIHPSGSLPIVSPMKTYSFDRNSLKNKVTKNYSHLSGKVRRLNSDSKSITGDDEENNKDVENLKISKVNHSILQCSIEYNNKMNDKNITKIDPDFNAIHLNESTPAMSASVCIEESKVKIHQTPLDGFENHNSCLPFKMEEISESIEELSDLDTLLEDVDDPGESLNLSKDLEGYSKNAAILNDYTLPVESEALGSSQSIPLEGYYTCDIETETSARTAPNDNQSDSCSVSKSLDTFRTFTPPSEMKDCQMFSNSKECVFKNISDSYQVVQSKIGETLPSTIEKDIPLDRESSQSLESHVSNSNRNVFKESLDYANTVPKSSQYIHHECQIEKNLDSLDKIAYPNVMFSNDEFDSYTGATDEDSIVPYGYETGTDTVHDSSLENEQQTNTSLNTEALSYFSPSNSTYNVSDLCNIANSGISHALGKSILESCLQESSQLPISQVDSEPNTFPVTSDSIPHLVDNVERTLPQDSGGSVIVSPLNAEMSYADQMMDVPILDQDDKFSQNIPEENIEIPLNTIPNSPPDKINCHHSNYNPAIVKNTDKETIKIPGNSSNPERFDSCIVELEAETKDLLLDWTAEVVVERLPTFVTEELCYNKFVRVSCNEKMSNYVFINSSPPNHNMDRSNAFNKKKWKVFKDISEPKLNGINLNESVNESQDKSTNLSLETDSNYSKKDPEGRSTVIDDESVEKVIDGLDQCGEDILSSLSPMVKVADADGNPVLLKSDPDYDGVLLFCYGSVITKEAMVRPDGFLLYHVFERKEGCWNLLTPSKNSPIELKIENILENCILQNLSRNVQGVKSEPFSDGSSDMPDSNTGWAWEDFDINSIDNQRIDLLEDEPIVEPLRQGNQIFRSFSRSLCLHSEEISILFQLQFNFSYFTGVDSLKWQRIVRKLKMIKSVQLIEPDAGRNCLSIIISHSFTKGILCHRKVNGKKWRHCLHKIIQHLTKHDPDTALLQCYQVHHANNDSSDEHQDLLIQQFCLEIQMEASSNDKENGRDFEHFTPPCYENGVYCLCNCRYCVDDKGTERPCKCKVPVPDELNVRKVKNKPAGGKLKPINKMRDKLKSIKNNLPNKLKFKAAPKSKVKESLCASRYCIYKRTYLLNVMGKEDLVTNGRCHKGHRIIIRGWQAYKSIYSQRKMKLPLKPKTTKKYKAAKISPSKPVTCDINLESERKLLVKLTRLTSEKNI